MDIFPIVNNMSLLLILTIPYRYLHRRFEAEGRLFQIFTGVFFGAASIVGMIYPMTFSPGVIFDARSVLGSIAGLYGGPFAGVIFTVIAAAYRIHLGGAGAFCGVGVISSSALFGVILRGIRKKQKKGKVVGVAELYFLGIAVHLAMLLWMLTLPSGVYAAVAIPVMVVFPLGTALMGKLMSDDIEHFESEKAAISNEHKYRELVENANSMILKTDMRGNIIFINEYAQKFFGYSEEEILGRPAMGTIIPEIDSNGTSLKDLIADIYARTGKYLLNENENVCKDGKRVWVAWNNKGIFDDQGRQVGLLCVGNDITDRIKADQEKEKLQNQLLHSQKMQAIGHLAGGVAHDFNNMLGVILGNAQLLKSDTPPGDPQVEEIDEIITAAQRSRDLTSKLLLFARKDSAKDLKVVPVQEVFQSIEGFLRRSIPLNIKIQSEIKHNCLIKCDVTQINQALLNLCINAIDAMPKGGLLRMICAKEESRDLQCITCGAPMEKLSCLIEISDTGIGIPEVHMNSVIEPFFTTKGVGKGTGLGLSVTHGIITGHDGHMHIQSELGKGTVIRIFLPLAQDADADEDNGADTELPAGTEWILVVDDERGMLKMAGKILEKAGYKPLCIDNGKEAVALYAQKHGEIALAILDMMMPDMDGPEVYGRLKEINEDIKALFASGQNISEEAESLFDKSRQQFLQKPFLMEEILRKVRNMIDGI